ncbi:MAG: hypothetical protein U0974_11910 [Gemmatimonadales bacterium]|nr:hypothetical protein [Gemmatimonadales bacterium]
MSNQPTVPEAVAHVRQGRSGGQAEALLLRLLSILCVSVRPADLASAVDGASPEAKNAVLRKLLRERAVERTRALAEEREAAAAYLLEAKRRFHAP